LNLNEATSSERETTPNATTTAIDVSEGAEVVDPYVETSNEQSGDLEGTGTTLVESDSAGTMGSVESAPGFNEARVFEAGLGFAQEVPVTKDLEALPDVGELEFPGALTVCGSDERVQISPATDTPWRWICKLNVTMANGAGGGCTGWFIGPRTVMTAGHCVFSHGNGGWVRQIEVVPGMAGASRPFGSQTSGSFRSVTGWTSSQNEEFDYGAIIMPNATLGNQVGFFGFTSLSDASLRGMIGNNSGYPGDKPFGTEWFNADPISGVSARRLEYMIDTAGGQSGSVVWRSLNGQRHAVGIHGYGGCPNKAVRINQEVFNNMLGWKNV
jgi:glutamyl endopeptidase